MAIMEGPLSKWTNVMQGWQYRWFVLNENVSLLSYYTSKEKMKRGSRRGCVRLKGAVVGIDDEDESNFTITTHDHKTFHFQARDGEERQKWVEALEESVNRASKSRTSSPKAVPSSAELDRKLAETDAYLQLLIGRVKELDEKISLCTDEESIDRYNLIKVTAQSLIESVKQTIVMMQLAKPQVAADEEDDEDDDEEMFHSANHDVSPRSSRSNSLPAPKTRSKPALSDVRQSSEGDYGAADITTNGDKSTTVPGNSYSSSEDDEFFDTADVNPEELKQVTKTKPPTVIASQFDIYDELYDDRDEEELGNLSAHGSIISHLLSQVRIGMDLTKIVLPTFILERRSLLEMFADFFSHPDLFVRIGDYSSPEERITEVVRWYMSAFHAGRNSSVAKKPYNPILGETFQCVYEIPGDTSNGEPPAESGPVKWATKSHLCYIAEQVSHHPPISAFYAECQKKRISLDGYIWMKSKFLGLSIGVDLVGQAVISLLDHEEEYKITFPSGYGRSILTIPWIELGGKCTVACEKTGYTATIEFQCKPFYGGKKHAIKGQVFPPGGGKPTCTVNGEWNGVMFADYSSGRNEVFCDTTRIPIVKKRVQSINEQDPFDSRRLWKDVTYNLKNKDVEGATKFKHQLEQQQREEAQKRKETGAKIQHKHFQEVGEHWVYTHPLVRRLSRSPKTVES